VEDSFILRVPDMTMAALIVPEYFAMHGYGGGGGVPGTSGASISTPLPLPRKLPVLEVVIVALELVVPSPLVTVVEIVAVVGLIGVKVPLIWQGKLCVSPSEVRLQFRFCKLKPDPLGTSWARKETLSESTFVALAAENAPGPIMSRAVPAIAAPKHLLIALCNVTPFFGSTPDTTAG
jgi:hypothetical protein